MSSLPESVRDRLSPAQAEAWDAVEEHGSARQAAKALGKEHGSFCRLVKRAKKAAALAGYAPDHDMVKPAAPGFGIRGTSTLYTMGEGGERISAQWVKTSRDAEEQADAIQAHIDAWSEAIRGKIKPVKKPKAPANDALMSLYPIGDPHFGLYCWAAEVGSDFDLHIAEQDLCAAVDFLVDQSPASKRGVLVNLGDLFHYDSMENLTPASGNVVDSDSRPQKMIEVGVRALRRCIHRMLEKHETVEIINAPGNHDPILSRAMNVFMANIYESEPRVKVHSEPTTRHYIRHGKCLIGVVHGHQTKDRDLPGIMATEKPEDWGQTRHRHYWRGHHHHDDRTEFNGCVVEQFRSLAAGDAYAVGSGYLSGRDMKCIVMHKDFGERARFTCGIDVLRAA